MPARTTKKKERVTSATVYRQTNAANEFKNLRDNQDSGPLNENNFVVL